ncbi:transglutaminase-like domain-containing protein [Sinorhizobium americanum]|uniref:Transglutaminase-like protein n=1 Tax=Sinorhizobium americanum TaxID=194963 RepID=A0A1L3LPY3_9HYPH|nr:transglutaminase family protein [Sinorhizobium americanum]APG85491.1 transglutaminase-like protein [Sinorhizobium americanum CCGM7]APG92150.1 transglutaminase-like protein [Sinorhizobium americanum]OAP34707.1 transglutaminase [Sinorhizobium americanum]
MFIRFGYEIGIDCPQPTPMMTFLSVAKERRNAVVTERGPVASPLIPMEEITDPHHNICLRMVLSRGETRLGYDAVISDDGRLDASDPLAEAVPVEKLPPSLLPYLCASRYCETDRLSALAWRLFGGAPAGWQRVQAICDYVHDRLIFSYGYAQAMRTALEAHEDRLGVSRDYAHLAVAFCRCMNMPARYVHGYMADIGASNSPAPMDFNAWFEVFLGDRWYTFDAKNNGRRAGRIPVARGRDAADIPLIQTFGKHQLTHFTVWTSVEPDGRLSRSHRSADVSLLNPWFSETWSRHLQERERNNSH